MMHPLVILGLALAGGYAVAKAAKERRPKVPQLSTGNGSSAEPSGRPEPFVSPPRDPGRVSGDNRTYWQIFGDGSKDETIRIVGRAIRSARLTANVVEARALAWAVRNLALANQLALADFLEEGRPASEQQVSTVTAATSAELSIADAVLSSPQSDDPTQGSTMWIDVDAVYRAHRTQPDTAPSLETARAAASLSGAQHLHTAGTIEFYGI